MCGACPGGTTVSKTTAKLNELGVKYQLLSQLRQSLAPGCQLTVLGDSWSLRRRNGSQAVFSDIEDLIYALDHEASSDWLPALSVRSVVTSFLVKSF